MLKLTTKGQYGVRAMFEIAKGYPDEAVNVRQVSERQDVSIPYLEQILNQLRHAELIKSVKGPGGGYLLTKGPDRISIADILFELEGPVTITSCLNPNEGCVRVDSCVTHLLWKALGTQIENFLETITLNDLLNVKEYDDFTLIASIRKRVQV